MSKHKVGDLVYHKGTLGYVIKVFDPFNRYNGEGIVHNYQVHWFNRNMEDDVSSEWDDTMDGLKRNLQEYLMTNHY